MGLGSALGSIGSSVVSGALGYLGAHQANNTAMAMSREQMEWQERMSNTAHQREVKDLREAGLNPILSAMGGNGASFGNYQNPTIQNEFGDFGNEINKGVNSALNALQIESNINKQNAEIDNLVVQNENLNSARALAEAQTKTQEIKNLNETNVANAQAAALLSQVRLNAANSAKVLAEKDLIDVSKPKERAIGEVVEFLTDFANQVKSWQINSAKRYENDNANSNKGSDKKTILGDFGSKFGY